MGNVVVEEQAFGEVNFLRRAAELIACGIGPI